MNEYLFKTETTMKEYNNNNWWVDKNYISKEYTIKADNVNDALKVYVEKVNKDYYDIVSKNALKNKQEMFIDTNEGTKQIGYVLTGKTLFDNGNTFVEKYVDLWVTILKLEDAFN